MKLNKSYKYKSSNGYVALSTALILSAVFLLLFLEITILSIGGIERATDAEEAYKASVLANRCIDKALYELRINWSYNIADIYSQEDINCEVRNVMRYGDRINFEVMGESSGYEKNLELEVELTEEDGEEKLKITSWQEI